MELQQIEYYHNRGLMPDWAYYQQNGKSAQENYMEQRNKFIKKIEKQKKLQELERQLEEQLFQALMVTLDEGKDSITDDVANDVVRKIHATFEGGAIHPERLTNSSFHKQLAVMLGTALGKAPFKLLEEAFSED